MRKRIFLQNAVILIIVSFLLRSVSLLFRGYLAKRLGADGMGVYQLTFSVFITAIAFSTAGIHLLSLRVVTAFLSRQEQGKIRAGVWGCMRYGLAVSFSAAVLLVLLARPAAQFLLQDIRAARSLQILAVGLPFMACSSVIKGYFSAVKKTFPCAFSDVLEQAVTVGLPLAVFSFSFCDLQKAVEVLMAGSSMGEMASFFFLLGQYKKEVKGERFGPKLSVKKEIRHIAFPATISSTARNILATVENLLIPYGLKTGGMSAQAALSQYGILHGMAYPTLVFPSALLLPFSSLLVPELAEALAKGQKRTAERIVGKALRWSFAFSLFAACVFYGYAFELGEALFQNREAGRYIRFMAPLTVLIYTDCVVDGILKGLDQQTASCRYNLIDGALRVLLILFLVPRFGMEGYLCVLFFSAIFNGALSFSKLLKVSGAVVFLLEDILLPLLLSIVSVAVSQRISGCFWLNLAFCIAVYAVGILMQKGLGQRSFFPFGKFMKDS